MLSWVGCYFSVSGNSYAVKYALASGKNMDNIHKIHRLINTSTLLELPVIDVTKIDE